MSRYFIVYPRGGFVDIISVIEKCFAMRRLQIPLPFQITSQEDNHLRSKYREQRSHIAMNCSLEWLFVSIFIIVRRIRQDPNRMV